MSRLMGFVEKKNVGNAIRDGLFSDNSISKKMVNPVRIGGSKKVKVLDMKPSLDRLFKPEENSGSNIYKELRNLELIDNDGDKLD